MGSQVNLLPLELPIFGKLVLPRTKAAKLFIAFGLSLVFALSSSVALPLPFTPVPIAFTLPLIFFFSAVLGNTALLAVFFYLIEGFLGLPVFANGGAGLAYMMGPTGGYLIGYALAASMIVAFSSKQREKKGSAIPQAKLFGIFALASGAVYLCGALYLGVWVGFDRALACGVYPFMGLELLKLLAVSKMAALFRS